MKKRSMYGIFIFVSVTSYLIHSSYNVANATPPLRVTFCTHNDMLLGPKRTTAPCEQEYQAEIDAGHEHVNIIDVGGVKYHASKRSGDPIEKCIVNSQRVIIQD